MDRSRPDHTKIAVVGIGCWYAGSPNPTALWENVVARRAQFRRVPERRTSGIYFDPSGERAETIYQRNAAVIDGFQFDWARYRIPLPTFLATDIAHWLALEVADQALTQAGYPRGRIAGERAGVVVGNSLTGERVRATMMRLRWPFIARVVEAAASAHGLPAEARAALLGSTETLFKSVFPETTEDTLAGALSNTIAGRICNYFDLHGGGFNVDGACASSLLAVSTAADLLAGGDLDLALAGGVDVSLDPFELVGFSEAGALSRSGLARVFDRDSDGFLPGEGAGFVVLKRLEDARAAGDKIYAVVSGWGISSDGKGGIMQPTRAGQAAAVRRAHAKAGFDVAKLHFVEAHGTGTRVGDATEIGGIALAVADRRDGDGESVGITSIKSVIGHAKAAAGVAGFIKAVLGVHRRVVPPTAGVVNPNPAFSEGGARLHPIRRGRVLGGSEHMRAGVSAFGFGGINCHIAIESGDARGDAFAPSVDEASLLAHPQDSEVFALGAETTDELRARAAVLADEAELLSAGELVDLSAALGRALVGRTPEVRAAVVAGSPASLAEHLRRIATLDDGALAGGAWTSSDREVFVARGRDTPRIGFVFPGQGSQQLEMGRELVSRHRWARELWHAAENWARASSGVDITRGVHREEDHHVDAATRGAWKLEAARTELAQPAIVTASILYLEWLARLGIRPTVVTGHSLGELTAFHAAGAFDASALVRLAALRGQAMAARGEKAGAMVGLACDRARAQQLCHDAGGYVTIANVNAPDQIVVSGDKPAIAAVVAAAEAAGIATHMLPVSNAFHSRLVAGAADVLRSHAPIPRAPAPLRCGVVSGVGGTRVPPTIDLHDHFAAQVLAPVDFVAAVQTVASGCDLLIEVGPGRVLSGLVTRILGPGRCLPVAGEAGSFRDRNAVVAAAFVHGAAIDWTALFDGRLVREHVAPSARTFVENPCEAALPAITAVPLAIAADDGMLAGVAPEYLARRGAFLRRALAGIVAADHEPSAAAPVVAAPIVPASVVAAPVEPAPVPAVVPAAPPIVPSAAALLVELAAARTGYPAASIAADARLLDDLNLDSIKAGELVASAARRLGVADAVDPSAYANATLAEIAAALGRAAPERAVSVPVPAPAPVPVPVPVPVPAPTSSPLIDLVSARTGYPASSITLDARLLDDLNLDSIKAGELVATFARRAGVADRIDASAFANATLAEVLAAVEAVTGPTTSLPVAAPPVAAPPVAAPPVLAPPVADDLLAELVALVARRTGYPAASIAGDARLLDDLNLDSIKAGELVASFARARGVADRIDASAHANARLLDVVADVRAALGPQAPATEPAIAPAPLATSPVAAPIVAATAHAADPATLAARDWTDSWVRDYAVDVREQPLATVTPIAWPSARVLVLTDTTDTRIADAIRDDLTRRGASVRITGFDPAAVAAGDATHVIGVLPRRGPAGALDRRGLGDIVGRLAALARVPQGVRDVTVAFVQFGGGRFASDTSDVASGCTLAFCRSLHLERPELRVRTIDLAAELDGATASSRVLDELATDERLGAAGYDALGVRRVPAVVLQEPGRYVARSIRWSASDVVLFTGGAKGITAECALAFARATGATVALAGRAVVDADPELAASLARFEAAGIRHRYYTCDAADRPSVLALVDRVRRELGPITGVVHGAGLMRPRRAEFINVAGAIDEIAPKLLGAVYLAEALASAPPRLFIGFSSLTAVIGMHGNATYTFANEALDQVLRRFGHEHPETEVLSIAWGLWGEVGGGVKLETTKNIARLGLYLGLVAPAEGARRFVELCRRRPAARHLAVTGRVIGFSTWDRQREAPALASGRRFVDEVLQYEPEVELVVRTRLDHARDTFMRDHDFRGSILLPSVIMLEAAAQVATCIGGSGREVIAIEDMDVPRPVVVPPGEGLTIELAAERLEGTSASQARVRVVLRSEATGFRQSYFTATVVLGHRCSGGRERLELGEPLAIEPRRDLYGRNFFVAGLFERMLRIHAVDPHRAVCEAEFRRASADGREGFAAGASGPLLLGDPFCRDTLLHTSILSDTQILALPLGIDRIEFFEGAFEDDRARVCISRLRRIDERNLVADLICADRDGRVLERVDGFRIRVMEQHPEWPSARELADAGVSPANDEMLLRKALAS